MIRKYLAPICGAFLLSTALVAPAQAAGDLLVAPTRVVIDDDRGTLVILNNVGSAEATYRITLELRRMTPEGGLAEIAPEEANALEKAALEMIRFAPRRVTLPPNQPQSIRIGVAPIAGLADGEYRAHMLFRAIPDTTSVTEATQLSEGVSIALTPIYGVTIPIIIRKGRLEATAAIANPHVENNPEGYSFVFDLSRQGTASTYGEVIVSKPGIDEPVLVARGIAVYPEIDGRKVALPITPDVAAQLTGPLTVEYVEPSSTGGGQIARIQTVLQ